MASLNESKCSPSKSSGVNNATQIEVVISVGSFSLYIQYWTKTLPGLYSSPPNTIIHNMLGTV